MTSRLTLGQARAVHALMKVDVAKDLPRPFDYKSCVESLPAAIVMNGFGQACATLLAKAGGASGDTDAHRLVYDHLEDWLCVCVAMGLKKPLMQAVVHSDQSKYCHAQAEALAYLVWLKKFAQAFLPRQAKGAGNGQD